MNEFISLLGLILAVFVFGISVGKLVEKIERIFRRYEDKNKQKKSDRR